MSNKVNLTAAHFTDLKPTEVVKDELVRQRFIDLYATLWDKASSEAVYEREAIYFNKLIADSPNLKACTAISVFLAFIDLAVHGLSLEPGTRALAYLEPRRYKTGSKDSNGKDIYEVRCVLKISGYGELLERTRSGQIRHADNPVIVFEGDEFSFSDRNGMKSVDYTLNINHNSQKPVASFMRITRADGTIDYAILLEEGWRRLAGFSGKANKVWDNAKREYVERPNPLYTSGEGNSIDLGFLKAKCIKHAFSTYPKLRTGRGSAYESDDVQRQEEDFYAIDNSVTEKQASTEEESFAPAADTSAGVVVDPSQSDDGDDETF